MQTIVDKRNKLSLFLEDDETLILPMQDHIKIVPSNKIENVIGDLNFFLVNVYENITPPNDWASGKYFYKNNEWTLNPNWSEPIFEEPQPIPED